MKPTLQEVLDHPIVRTLNPKGKKFIQARVLSPRLNPFSKYGVNMLALIPFGNPFPHIKAVPAFKMMLDDFSDGRYADAHTIVVDSSGNTAHAVARLAPAFGFREVKIVLAADVPESKKGILAALSSVEIIEVGKGKSVAARAREEAEKLGHVHLNQYGHLGNLLAHEQYTASAILHACDGAMPAIIAAAMGSGGTAAGIGSYCKHSVSGANTLVLGVRPSLGQQVPGARDEKRMKEVVTLPWEEFVSLTIDVDRKSSFIGMRELWSEVEPQPGPSSGMAYVGLMRYLENLSPGASFFRHKRDTVAFICPDDGRFYSERTTGELDPDQGVI